MARLGVDRFATSDGSRFAETVADYWERCYLNARSLTIYAGTSGGQGHTFIEVAGIVLDTVHGSATTPAGTGPRWQPASEIAYELSSGSFVTRHPQGL